LKVAYQKALLVRIVAIVGLYVIKSYLLLEDSKVLSKGDLETP
jgi:hypothetical protein